MARAANLIVALSARNGLCVAGGSPFRKHIAIVGSTNHLCSSKSCKFEQIMGRADQQPFLFDLVQPAQQELPEPACLLDEVERGADHRGGPRRRSPRRP
jgi:hypothetical protein